MHKALTSFILIALISLPAAAFAEMALVPQSGQTLCYDATGTEIPCAGTGQDGDLQMGVPWPDPRFTDNNNGTITDNLTGLIWLKNGGCRGYDYFWASALSSANALASGACGLSDGSVAGDWRLPNRKELESLINRQQSDQGAWLNTAGFSSVVSGGWYWSSSTNSTNNGSAWLVYFGNGSVVSMQKTGYYVNGFIWPVRGGQ